MNDTFSWDRYYQMPLIGIMRNIPPQHTQKLVNLYLDAGLTTLEVTMNSRSAAESIAAMVSEFGNRANIGAGTVCTKDDLEQAVGAGAQFIVTPIVNDDVIKACVRAKIPVFPGAFSPTEIYKAWKLGATMVKVFPATKLGPEFIKDVLAPLNQVKLIPTGGISLNNLMDYFKAGAQGVGIGSEIFPNQLIRNEQWSELSNLFLDFVKKYHQFKDLHTV